MPAYTLEVDMGNYKDPKVMLSLYETVNYKGLKALLSLYETMTSIRTRRCCNDPNGASCSILLNFIPNRNAHLSSYQVLSRQSIFI